MNDAALLAIISNTVRLQDVTKKNYLRYIKEVQMCYPSSTTIHSIIINGPDMLQKYTVGKENAWILTRFCALMFLFKANSDIMENHYEIFKKWNMFYSKVKSDEESRKYGNSAPRAAFKPMHECKSIMRSIKWEEGMWTKLVLMVHLTAPARCDYGHCPIYRSKVDPKSLKRDIPSHCCLADEKIYLTKYKTADIYGMQCHRITPELMAYIKKSLSLQPRQYLFCNISGKPLSNEQYSLLVRKSLKPYFGSSASVNMLRKVYVTAQNPSAMTLSEQKELGSTMMHSVATLNSKYDMRNAESVRK